MRHFTLAAALVAATAAFGLAAAVPAQAASGQVVVFSDELQPLDVYHNPNGCTQVPISAHVLENQTDKPVHVYGDPFCAVPAPIPVLQPGYGTHVSQVGSFKAE